MVMPFVPAAPIEFISYQGGSYFQPNFNEFIDSTKYWAYSVAFELRPSGIQTDVTMSFDAGTGSYNWVEHDGPGSGLQLFTGQNQFDLCDTPANERSQVTGWAFLGTKANNAINVSFNLANSDTDNPITARATPMFGSFKTSTNLGSLYFNGNLLGHAMLFGFPKLDG